MRQRADVHRGTFDPQLAHLQTRDIKEGYDHFVQARHLVIDDTQGALVAFVEMPLARRSSLEKLRLTEKRRQRCLEFVSGDREKLIAQPYGLLGILIKL